MRTFYLAIIATLFATAGFAQTQTVIFETNGTKYWTAPCGVTSVTIEVWGAGGAGARRTTNGAGGAGGGGAYVRSIRTVNPTQTYTLYVGKGGTTGNNNNTGEDSYAVNASTVMAKGGKGVDNNTATGGAGGLFSQSVGDIRYSGGNGATGVAGSYGGGGGSSAGSALGGTNATNQFGATAPVDGGNGGNGRAGTQGDGSDGINPGGGGGGSLRTSATTRDGGSGADGKIVITYEGMSSIYCDAFHYENESITNVTFAGIANPNAYNTESYQLFCLTGEVMLGGTYPIAVRGNTGGNYTNQVTVFIDWNGDGDFNDANEVNTTLSTITNSTGLETNPAASRIASGNVTVPANAKLGYTKMRIRKVYGGFATSACADYDYGQTEDYTLLITGSCQQPTSVTANATATSITICTGTQVTLKKVGGQLGAGQSWKWYSVSCGGTLLNTNTDVDATYTFTPPVGTNKYYLRAEGGTCGTTGACQTVEVIVKNNGTMTINTGNKDFQICRSAATANYVSFNLNGGVTGATVTGLPAGLNGSVTGSVFTIGGTTTAAAGAYAYVITPAGNAPCTNTPINGTVTVVTAPTGISYTTPVTYCAGSTITDNSPVITGGTANSYAIIPAIPAGMAFNTVTGVISGTPTATQGLTTYTVTATNDCGFTSGQVRIAISNGSTVYNILPAGTQNVCSTFGGIAITLSGSESGVNYQLLRNGTPTGSPVAGTGTAIGFGTQTLAGTYTVRTSNGCLTNMNGSTVINITPQPTTQFSYSTYNYCRTGTSNAASFTGTPVTGGTFTATPAGLVFSSNTTGVIDLGASSPGDYTIKYTIPAAGGCSIYSYTQPNHVFISNTPSIFEVTGGGAFCTGTGGVAVGLSNSQVGISYQLYIGGVATGTPVAGTGAAISFGNKTVSGNYTVIAKVGSCEQDMDGNAVVTANPAQAPISITASSVDFCQGNIVSLSAAGAPPTAATGTVVIPSGALGLAIPNDDATGVSNLIKVIGIPVGATITKVSINYNITHSWDGDLLINLKGPNGKVLNIANAIGNTGDNFTNTTVSSAATANIAGAVAPFGATYLPQAVQSVTGAQVVANNVSNATNFSGLYGSSAASANGNWTLSVRDNQDHRYFFGLFSYEDGEDRTFSNWTITIEYTTIANSVGVVWTPATDLYTDPAATIPYTANTAAATVYANPATPGTKIYTATATNAFGCTSTTNTSLNVKQSPVLVLSADYCSTPGSVKIKATSDINITNWTWSNGLGSGTVVGRTSTITPNSAGTFYITALSSGNSCPATASLSIAQELVVNGDFENGNTGFTSGYTSVAATTANGLQPAGTYAVNNNPNFNHTNFWGTDHTTANGDGNFMLVNGTNGPVVWQQTVTVLPNTDYYFSAYATSLNNITPFANLRFNVAGSQVGTSTGALPTKSLDNNPGTWKRFYGTWNSGTNTSAVIQIVDLENSGSGNDFGLDDISFGTLSTFLNLSSVTGSNAQTVCGDALIDPISYEVGGNGTIPVVTGLPTGLTTYWNGRDMSVKGTPTQYGTFNYQIKAEVCSGAFLTRSGTLTITAPSKAGNFSAPLISACYNTAGSIAVTGTVGGVTKWQSSTSPVTTWSDISNTTATLNYPALTDAMTYRVIAQNGTGCKTDTSVIVKVGIRNLWTGKTSNDWNTASNWSNETLPDNTCPSVIVPVIPSNIYPLITTGVISVANLDVKPGALLTIDNASLKVAGTITSTSGVDAANGTIVMNGTSTQTIAGMQFKNKNIKNLTIENNVNVTGTSADSIRIIGTLGFGSATGKTFNAGTNNIVLVSSFSQTANVGKVTGNTISGTKFTVERYINTGATSVANPYAHTKAWQLLAVPTTSAQSIKDAWQEGNAPTIDNKHGFGTMLSSPSSTPSNGFDAYSAGAYIKSYIPSSDQWNAGPATTTTGIATDRGWMTYVRGDRSSIATPKPTILRTTGSLITNDKTVTVTANKYDVVGNPYASEVDLRQLIRTNLTNEIYIWDPTLGGSLGFGRYRTLTYELDGNFHIAPFGTVYPDEITNMIQSGQAFFVKSNGQGPSSVKFTETAKSGNSNLVTRGGGASVLESLSINLAAVQADGSNILLDGSIAFFNDHYSRAADQKDGIKLLNSGENVGFRTDGKYLAVERRESPTATDTLNVEMASMKAQSYSWEIKTSNMTQPGRSAWLLDNFLNTKTPLALEGTTMISFDVNTTPASSSANRFKIIFSKIAGPLPVTFTAISATRNNDRSIAVKWAVENEINLDKYTVERSADGISFTGIITADVTQSRNYAKNDLSPLAADNYYRIKATSIGGQVQYSAIVKVAPLQQPASITVYPNPVEDKKMNISFVNQQAGVYNLQLINDIGQVMYTGSVKVSSINDRKQVSLITVKAAGRYTLKVTAADGSLNSINLLVQ